MEHTSFDPPATFIYRGISVQELGRGAGAVLNRNGEPVNKGNKVENVTKGEFNSAMEKIGRDFESLEDKLDGFMQSSRKEHLELKKDMHDLRGDMKEVLRQLNVKERRLDKLEGGT